MYRDREKQREATKNRVAKHRARGVTPDLVTPLGVTPDLVTPLNVEGQNVTPQNPTVENVAPINVTPLSGYSQTDIAHLKAFISQGNNLVKLQRICRELGKNQEHVFLGSFRLDDLGKAICS